MEFNTKYILPQFFQNLTKIRDETFKKSTIQYAFDKSRMWPINAQKYVKKLKVLNLNIEKKILIEPTLPQPWVNSKTLDKLEIEMDKWHEKMLRQIDWSDSARP